MKLPFFGQKNDKSQAAEDLQDGIATEAVEDTEVVDTGTKIKVVAALLVVAFATYIAYWVQEPGDIKVDVLADSQETGDSMAMESEMTAESSVTTENTVTSESETLVAEGETMTEDQEVSIIDFAFSPAELMVEKGMTVVWTNKDTVPHTVTGPDFSSGSLNPGESYSYTFVEDGTFEYSCSFHPQMQGTVTVGLMAAATEETEAVEPAATEAEDTLSPELLAPEETVPLSPAADETPVLTAFEDADVVALDAQALLESQALAAAAALETATHLAASEEEAARLAKSGPEDILYIAALGAIFYLNRRKLMAALR